MMLTLNNIYLFMADFCIKYTIYISVPDPWHFGVDPDPDPRIHASD